MSVDEVIQRDWASEPRVMEACLQVWHALSTQDHQLDHYTFSQLAQLATSSDEQLVSQVLLYLATPKLKVLSTCLMYEFEGGIFELPEDEVAHYAKGEKVIHPEFGEPISESEILLCFLPGPRLRSEGQT
jgi:hypothetical protein